MTPLPPSDMVADQLDIGAAIRRLRLARGLSLSRLAVESGVSKSNLSKVENNTISPTFDTIERIARGLDVPPAALLSPDTTAQTMLSFTDAGAGVKSESAVYQFEYLFSDLPNRRMVPFFTTVAAQTCEDPPAASSHAGEEFFTVLDGEVEFISEGQVLRVMTAGDSVYFNSSVQHLVRNRQDCDARLLWVWIA